MAWIELSPKLTTGGRHTFTGRIGFSPGPIALLDGNNMPFDDALKFVRDHLTKRVAIAAHQRPDGDAAGSALGLAGILREHGSGHACFVIPYPLPGYLRFLADHETLLCTQDSEWWCDFDCLIVVDCGDEDRLDDVVRPALQHLPTCTIDHHASSQGLGKAVWIDAAASSVGEMIVRLAVGAGWSLPASSAQALWTAIVTDTGRFSYENATAAALEAARICVESGAAPHVVAEQLYQSVSVQERKLQRLVLDRMLLEENGRLATSWLSREDFSALSCGTEAAKNMIELLRNTEGVDVAIFFYEPFQSHHPQEVKVSFRTKAPYDALEVTSRFGGGGHQRAAGCSVTGTMDIVRSKVTAAAKELYFTVTTERKAVGSSAQQPAGNPA